MNRRQALALLAGSGLAASMPPLHASANVPVLTVLATGEMAVIGEAGGILRFARLSGGPAHDRIEAHSGPVSAVAGLPDGWFFSAGVDGRIRLWRSGRARASHELFDGSGAVTALAVSEAIGAVAAGFADGRVRVWIGSGILDLSPQVYSGHTAAVTGLAFSADQKYIISGGADATIRRTHLVEGAVTTLETEGPVSHLTGVFDGEAVAAIGFGDIAVYLPGGPERLTLRAFQGAAAGLAVSPDGEWIAALDATGRAFVFDRFGGRPYWSDPGGEGRATALAFHPDSLTLILLDRDGELRSVDVRTGR